jgi:hypothetical protein
MPDKTDPSVYGEWEPIKYRFQHLPVHIALLHTGKVLAFGGSGNDPNHLDNPHPAEIFEPGELGKGNGRVYEISNNGIQGDVFCSGHAFLPDGKLLVAGGTFKYDNSIFGIPLPPFRGTEQSYIFDQTSLEWERMPDMNSSRWYPSCIMMPDGSVVVVAGLTKRFPWVFLNKIEVFALERKWTGLTDASHWLPLYPRLHLLPSGEIFYAGSFNTHYTFPFSVKAFPSATLNIKTKRWKTIGNPHNTNREEGTTVMLPLTPPDYTARILLIAGGTPQGKDAIRDVEIIDFSEDIPKYQQHYPLKHPRYYVYPVILPDKSILIVGGKSGQKGHLHNNMPKHKHQHQHNGDVEVDHHPDAILEPEILYPNANKWMPVADMKVDRLYHSNAILLPDGQVMTAGSNPQRLENELRIEIFQPPYLFKGKRPKIKKTQREIQYGKSFEIETSDNIKEICLIRPSVTTHCVNTEQRYVGLEFTKRDGNVIQASTPINKNLAPPGYYMLFIVDDNDIPSIAHFVCVLSS